MVRCQLVHCTVHLHDIMCRWCQVMRVYAVRRWSLASVQLAHNTIMAISLLLPQVFWSGANITLRRMPCARFWPHCCGCPRRRLLQHAQARLRPPCRVEALRPAAPPPGAEPAAWPRAWVSAAHVSSRHYCLQAPHVARPGQGRWRPVMCVHCCAAAVERGTSGHRACCHTCHVRNSR